MLNKKRNPARRSKGMIFRDSVGGKRLIRMKAVTSLPQITTDVYIFGPYRGTLPDNVKMLVFGKRFRNVIRKEYIPASTKMMVVSEDTVIDKDALPEKLEHLSYNKPSITHFEKLVLPKSLTHLTFGSSFNDNISDTTFPDSLMYLEFGNRFDNSIPESALPRNLSELKIGDNYDIPLPKLPSGLKSLTIGNNFDNDIILPEGLENLTLGDSFNRHIELPDGLLTLNLGRRFNKPVALPKTIKTLKIGGKYNHPLDLPESLENLTLGPNFGHKLNIPPNLISINVGNASLSGHSIPESVKSVNCVYDTHIPSWVESLKISEDVELEEQISLNNLHTLILPDTFDNPIKPGVLPSGLKKLVFGRSYNSPISPNTLPETIEEINFGDGFNQKLSPGMLPNSLKTIVFGREFNQPIPTDLFPSTLEEVLFGTKFNQRIEEGVLPSNIIKLGFGLGFSLTNIDIERLPSNIETLILHSGMTDNISGTFNLKKLKKLSLIINNKEEDQEKVELKTNVVVSNTNKQNDPSKPNLVLDLDETILHTSKSNSRRKSDLETIYVIGMRPTYLRPNIEEFLKKVSPHFNLYVYTHGVTWYAKGIIEKLGIQDDVIAYSARKSTSDDVSPKNIKDLNIDTSNTIIMDDRTDVWVAENRNNIINIPAFTGSVEDKHLDTVTENILNIKSSDNIHQQAVNINKLFIR